MFKFDRPFQPDADALLANLRRQGTPRRVHFLELFLDGEVQQEIIRRFDLGRGIRDDDPYRNEKRHIELQRFLGYEYVYAGHGVPMPTTRLIAADTAALPRAGGRSFVNETKGLITNWEEFEKYPWPTIAQADTRSLDWYEKNLPDDMCVIGATNAHFAEWLCWLMGYETLCYALYDQPELVQAIYDKVLELSTATMRALKGYTRVRMVWGSDDMGFKTGTLLSPPDMRRYVLAGHQKIAAMAHASGWLYLLHACGKLEQILGDLLDDVKIDAKHSYEDAIMPAAEAKRLWGGRIGILGGVDLDKLTRLPPDELRKYVRGVIDACAPGGRFAAGSGNSIPDYIPPENYLTMIDEALR